MTLSPPTASNQLDVRSKALDVATTVLSSGGKGYSTKELLETAKDIEKWIWGRFVPLEAAPTPLSTIEEAANATRDRLSELYENTADEELKKKISDLRPQWERFIADINSVLGAK